MIKKRSIFLYPLSLIYGLFTSVRNFLYNSGVLKSTGFDIPVICVGNITVGGTGKTPHSEYLLDLLGKNFRVAFLSRGYKRKSRGFRMAGIGTTSEEIGDEPMQVFSKFPGITVAVDSNRVNGVRNILKERPDTNVIILDDAYQHRRIIPGFSILLSDYGRLMIKDDMLPYGNLRESHRNMNRADIILVTKCPENLSPIQRRIIVKEINKAAYQNLYFTSIVYRDPVPLFGNPAGTDGLTIPDVNNDAGIVLVTGIAMPGPLLDYLKKHFTESEHLHYGDHHRFSVADTLNIQDAWSRLRSRRKYVITTEKDAVRLREFTNIAEPFRSSIYYIPVGINFLNEDKDEFDNTIIDYVRKNKRNNRIS